MNEEAVVIPVKFSERVREMQVDDQIDITEKGRAAGYAQARVAFTTATFITRAVDGKIYLIRTA